MGQCSLNKLPNLEQESIFRLRLEKFRIEIEITRKVNEKRMIHKFELFVSINELKQQNLKVTNDK